MSVTFPSSSNVHQGEYVNRGTPSAGDIYICTDILMVLYCHSSGVWTERRRVDLNVDILDLEDLAAHDGESYHMTASYVKRKTITCTSNASAFMFQFELKGAGGGRRGLAMVYINGVAQSNIAHNDASGVYETFNLYVDGIEDGDTMELWTKIDAADQNVYCKNFRVRGIPGVDVCVSPTNT